MGFFSWLPTTERCCLCTRNLKCACVLIIILGMLTSMHTAGMLCKPFCEDLYNIESPFQNRVNVFRWILFVCELILIASCFAFFLGIFWNQPITADILILSAIIVCVLSIPYAVLMLIQEEYTDCRWYYSQIFHLVLYFVMWCYFIIIINSYCATM